jgi:8-amino-7-oxononanoate synthase
MSRSYDDWLASTAAQRATSGLHRSLRYRDATAPLIDVASNDYLGLARDSRVVGAAAEAARTWGAGATGSRLVTGSTALHRDLESTLCDFLGGEDALVFSSGYTANLGVITALAGPESLVVSDADNHASVIDACRLARARVVVTPHADLSAVENALATRSEVRALVVVDAVFSTDGATADVVALRRLCERYDALLVVDEAHSVGVIGEDGRGLVATAGMAHDPDVIRTVTLSKALGSQGGAVLASRAVTGHLTNSARSFIFDTGLAPACAAAALAALTVLSESKELVARLHAHRDYLADALDVARPAGAVVSAVLGDPGRTLRAAETCREAGVLVGCFRPPSVPSSGSRLRLTARASLTEVEVKEACAVVLDAIGRQR